MSLFRQWVEEQLPVAEANLKHCEELLAQQQIRVAERKRRGIPSRESDKLLQLLEECRQLHLRHVASLQRDLERKDYDVPGPYLPPKTEPPQGRALVSEAPQWADLRFDGAAA